MAGRNVLLVVLGLILISLAAIAGETQSITASQGQDSLVTGLMSGGGAGALVLAFLWRQIEQVRAQIAQLSLELKALSLSLERDKSPSMQQQLLAAAKEARQ